MSVTAILASLSPMLHTVSLHKVTSLSTAPEYVVRCFTLITGVPRQLVKSGQATLAYLDALKKEYRALRKLWMSLHEHFSDCDELRQAAHRTRFMTPAEILMGDNDIPFAVNPFLVGVM